MPIVTECVVCREDSDEVYALNIHDSTIVKKTPMPIELHLKEFIKLIISYIFFEAVLLQKFQK